MTLLRNTLLVFSMLALGSIARADAIITGSTSSGDTFSIDVTTTYFAPGIVDITNATGKVTIDGVANTITGVEATTAPGVVTYSSTGFFIFDNLLFAPPATPFDYDGALFTLADGTDLELNLVYNNGDLTSGVYYNNSGYNASITSIQIASTPEPSSFVLLGSGLMASAFVLRRKLVPIVAQTGIRY